MFLCLSGLPEMGSFFMENLMQKAWNLLCLQANREFFEMGSFGNISYCLLHPFTETSMTTGGGTFSPRRRR
jgi:hypothetical protein